MSLDLRVYTKPLPQDLIPKIIARLNTFDMEVEVHPDFSFETQTGFLPFKFKLTNGTFKILEGKELISGFELYKDDFSLSARKAELNPKKGFFGKLLKSKEPEVPFAAPEIELKLQDCTTEWSFVWHAATLSSFDLLR